MNAGEALDVDELKDIAAKMGVSSPREFLRDKDAQKFDIPPDMDDEALYASMADNPRLIQRPIGIKDGTAALGRPVEKLLDIA
jgi:arsenate reductase